MSWADLEAAAARSLRRLGADEEESALVAGLLVRANLAGHDSHGVRMLSGLADQVRLGWLRPGARPTIDLDAGSIVSIDADGAFGQVAGLLAAELGARRAAEHGLAAICVRRAGWAGRIGDFAEHAAEAGIVSLWFATNSGGYQAVVPPGGSEPRLGTNPIAFGAPRAVAPHLVVDLAASQVSLGAVGVRRERGLPVPEAWVTGNGLRPLGGVKGLGLGLIGEVLAGLLTGAGACRADPGAGQQAMFTVAFDPVCFPGGDGLPAELDRLASYVTGGTDGLTLPGEHGAGRADRRRLEPVPEELWTHVARLD